MHRTSFLNFHKFYSTAKSKTSTSSSSSKSNKTKILRNETFCWSTFAFSFVNNVWHWQHLLQHVVSWWHQLTQFSRESVFGILHSSQFPVLPGIFQMSNTLPTPHEWKETSQVFLPLSFLPSLCQLFTYCHAFWRYNGWCRQNVSHSVWEDQLTNQKAMNNINKPSTNLTKIVKRKYNYAREVRDYFIAIQIPSFIVWTCCVCQRGLQGH